MLQVLLISGSLTEESTSSKVFKIIETYFKNKESFILEKLFIRNLSKDVLNYFLTNEKSSLLNEALHQIFKADIIIISAPIFNGSYSGVFKMFFDVLTPGSLNNKVIFPFATGGSLRHSLTVEKDIKPLFSYLGGLNVTKNVFVSSDDFKEENFIELKDRINVCLNETLLLHKIYLPSSQK